MRDLPLGRSGPCRQPGRQPSEADVQPLCTMSRGQPFAAKVAQTNQGPGTLYRPALHRVSFTSRTERSPMNHQTTRRSVLTKLGAGLAGILAFSAARVSKAAVRK